MAVCILLAIADACPFKKLQDRRNCAAMGLNPKIKGTIYTGTINNAVLQRGFKTQNQKFVISTEHRKNNVGWTCAARPPIVSLAVDTLRESTLQLKNTKYFCGHLRTPQVFIKQVARPHIPQRRNHTVFNVGKFALQLCE